MVVIYRLSGTMIGGPDLVILHDHVYDHLHQAEPCRQFIFNLGKVTQINATGLGMLITIYTKIRDQGGEMYLCELTDKINSLLTITKLQQVLQCFDNEEKAIIKFQTINQEREL
jgi:anti-sigma B factor antagonist